VEWLDRVRMRFGAHNPAMPLMESRAYTAGCVAIIGYSAYNGGRVRIIGYNAL
jgi:hypothetical protein